MRKNHLTREESHELAGRWLQHGDVKALQRMVESCMGLAVKMASDLHRVTSNHHRLDDMIQEACEGLVIGCRRYDPANNSATTLSTYVTYWIRCKLLEYTMRNHNAVRLGSTNWQRTMFFGLGRATRAIEARGQDVDAETLAVELKTTPENVALMLPYIRGKDVSLDAPMNHAQANGGRDERLPWVEDLRPNPEETLAEDEELTHQRKVLADGLATLSPAERLVIQSRHLSGDPKTLRQVGAHMKLSHERIRQLEERALEKLQQHAMRAA